MESCPRHHISFAAGSYCPGCIATIALQEDDEDHADPIASLGSYQIIRELGRGGMGVVYMARQAGLNRRVALKLLLSGSLAGEEFTQRFRREGELAASLQHPNIVRIFEAGEVDGELFFSMELISGGSLADWKQGKTLLPMDAAKIMRTLNAAVAHAHDRGILHRDLKPSNILIDEDGSPKVADFGLARPLETPHDLTLGTHAFGSPAYLAPELVRDPRNATPASDIYSLGAILYFLLSGRSPFVSASLDELLRQVRECEPAPPRLLDPSIPRDLQKICLKALDKVPARRYASAAEFGEDLQRFIEGRPVIARPAGPLMRGVRMAKRAPWLTASLAAFTLALLGGIAGTLWQAKIANKRADESNRNATQLRLNLYASDIAAASTAVERGDAPLANEILSRWENPPDGQDLRGFEWRFLKHQSRPAAHRLLDHRKSTITSVAPSPDGLHLAIADQSGSALVRPIDGGKAQTLPIPSAEEITAIPQSLGGGWVCGGKEGIIRWISNSGATISETSGRQFSIATRSPRAIVAAVPRYHWWGKAGAAHIFDWKSGTRLKEIPGTWRHTAISPDGTKAALAGLTGGLVLLDIGSGSTRELPTSSPVWALSFSPDGGQLAAGGSRYATIWDLNNDALLPTVLPHDLTVWTTSFSEDGTRFLTSSSDRRVRVWRTTAFSEPPITLSGHRSEVWCAAFSPDGKSVFAGGKSGEVLVWNLTASDTTREIYPHDLPSAPIFTTNGEHLITHYQDHSYLHDLEAHTSEKLPDGILALGISGDSSLLVTSWAGKSGSVLLADLHRVTFHDAQLPSTEIRQHLCISKGRWISRVLADGTVNLSSPATGEIIHRLKGPPPGMRHTVAGSPDGRWVTIGGDGQKSLALHDLQSGREMRLSPESSYYYVATAFSPDGTLIAAGDLSGPIQIWNVLDRSLIATLPGHPEEASAVAFSPDGRTLASMGFHQDLKLWNVATWREVISTKIADAGSHLAFSPSGDGLIITTGRTRNERAEWLPAPWTQN